MKLPIILLFLLPLLAFGQITPEQQKSIDSLQIVIETAEVDSSIFQAKMRWAKIVYASDAALAISLLKEIELKCKTVLNNAEKPSSDEINTDYKNYLKTVAFALGDIHHHHNNFETAVEYFNRSIQLATELENFTDVVENVQNLGSIYEDRGEIDLALQYYEQSIKLSKEIGFKKGTASLLNNIGNVYNDKNENDKAMEYYERGLNLSKEIGYKRGIDINSHNMGRIYEQEGNLVKAIEYYHISWKICEELGERHGTSISLYTIGGVYLRQNEYDKALDFFKQGTTPSV